MKKILLVIVMFLFFTAIISCNNDSSEPTIQTTNINETTNPTTIDNTTIIDSTTEDYDVYYPDYPDDDYFTYAEVMLYFIYDIPSEGFSDRQSAKEFYETRNLLNFDSSNLESEGNFDDYYLSSYTPFAGLIYRSKAALFDDFYLLKTVYEEGYIQSPTIRLNTVGSTLQLSLESNINDLIELTEKYFGTEISYNSIQFEVINTSTTYFGEGTFGDTIIKTHTEYLTDYPENDFDLTEEFFDTKVLIRTGFGHSGSIHIGDIGDLFYLDDTTLEIAVSATAASQIMTQDYWPYMIVISMEKSILRENTDVTVHLHITFLNGYLYDRPFHNIYDDNN